MTAEATRPCSHLCGYRYRYRIQVQFSVLSAALEPGLPVLHLALSVWPFESNICVVQVTHCPQEASLFSDLTGFIFPCESSQSHLNVKILGPLSFSFQTGLFSVRGRFQCQSFLVEIPPSPIGNTGPQVHRRPQVARLGGWEAWTLLGETLGWVSESLPSNTAPAGGLSKLLEQVARIAICELWERGASFK